MTSIMESVFGGGNTTEIGDAVIANDMLASGKALATQYFTASLESATPEVRRLFSEYAAQKAEEHGALSKLAVQNDWYKAYDSTAEQLQNIYQQSQSAVGNDMQQS